METAQNHVGHQYLAQTVINDLAGLVSIEGSTKEQLGVEIVLWINIVQRGGGQMVPRNPGRRPMVRGQMARRVLPEEVFALHSQDVWRAKSKRGRGE